MSLVPIAALFPLKEPREPKPPENWKLNFMDIRSGRLEAK